MAKKGKRINTYKGDGINTCRCCEANLGKYPAYHEACSSDCANSLAELRAIPLPAQFVISLVNRTSNTQEIEKQLKKYVEFHKLDETKVFLKFKDMVSSIKEYGISSIKRKPLNQLIAC